MITGKFLTALQYFFQSLKTLGQSRKFRNIALATLTLPLLTPLAAFDLGSLGEGLYRYALVAIGFSLIITFHEFGHFIVARLCSVKCEVFSIGIGPRMFGWKKGIGLTFGNEPEPQKLASKDSKTIGSPAPQGNESASNTTIITEKGSVQIQPDTVNLTSDILGKTTPAPQKIGETDYRISWLPLGGYVRMLGQDDMDPNNLSTDPRAFNRRPIWQRMCIISAGVTMNLIFAAVVFAFVFSKGIPFPPAQVGQVLANSPAEKAGLKMGDQIIAINGESPKEGFLEFSDLVIASALSSPGETLHLTIQRAGETTPRKIDVVPVRNPANGMLAIGVAPMNSLKLLSFEKSKAEDLKDIRPELLKIRSGDYIAALNGKPVNDFVSFYQDMQSLNGQPAKVTLKNDNNTEQELTLNPQMDIYPVMPTETSDKKSTTHLLGLQPAVKVAEVMDGPGKQAGLQKDDVFLRIGAISFPNESSLRETIKKNVNQTISIDVLRGTEIKNLQATPVGKDGDGQLKFMLSMNFDSPLISQTFTGNENTQLTAVIPGSKIVSLNGHKVKNWSELLTVARQSVVATTTQSTATLPAWELTFLPPHADTNAEPTKINFWPTSEQLASLNQFHYLMNLPVEQLVQTQQSHSIPGAVKMGLVHTSKYIMQTYMTLRGLFMQTVPASELHGPLGIAKLGYEVQEKGFTYLIFILAVVSVNLAVANFLPLPIVDGGLFLMLILEKIRGKPLPEKFLSVINIAGLCLLGGLFLYVTVNNDLMLFFK